MIQVLQLRLNDLMVILIPGVTGNSIINIRILFPWKIIKRQTHYGKSTIDHNGRINSALYIALKPFHITRATVIDPLTVLFGMGSLLRPRYSAIVKT